MNPPLPSRLALTLFDRFIPDDEPLRGDLLEEFELRRSQWWLWRQVLGAVVCRRPRPRLQQTHTMTVLSAALLLLVSFEAVFALNLVQRLILGPAMPDIAGYFYLWQNGMEVPTGPRELLPVLWLPALLSVAASMPAGWMIGALHPQHKTLAVALFTVSIALCAVLNLGSPFAWQLLTMLIFVMGLLVGGRFAAASQAGPTAASRLIT